MSWWARIMRDADSVDARVFSNVEKRDTELDKELRLADKPVLYWFI